MSENRVPTGINGLDKLIEGGFPRGSLILLAGNPGTGKTVFSMQFLYKGAENYGENGIYVSFAENEDTIIHNISRLFGYDPRKCIEEHGTVKVLDFATMREKGLSAILEMVLEEIAALKAKRLVVDSFSAMAQAFKEPIEARIILHTILGKLIRQLECTTILIVEVPTGSDKIGVSIEEFVADGVIVLRKDRYDSRLVREIEIEKLRGTRLERQRFLFTMDKGVQVFPPFSFKEVEAPKEFEPTRGTKTHYPSGILELDEILGGGYPRGYSVFYELGENVPVDALNVVINPTLANFIMRERGVLIIPMVEYGHEDVRRMVASFTGEEKFDKFARIITNPGLEPDENKPYTLVMPDPAVEPMDVIQGARVSYIEVAMEMANKLHKNLLHFLGGDFLAQAAERFTPAIIGRSIVATRAAKDLLIFISKPSLPKLTKFLADTVNIHFKMEERNGSMILFGKKPKTIIYNIEPDASRGCRVKLTPIV